MTEALPQRQTLPPLPFLAELLSRFSTSIEDPQEAGRTLRRIDALDPVPARSVVLHPTPGRHDRRSQVEGRSSPRVGETLFLGAEHQRRGISESRDATPIRGRKRENFDEWGLSVRPGFIQTRAPRAGSLGGSGFRGMGHEGETQTRWRSRTTLKPGCQTFTKKVTHLCGRRLRKKLLAWGLSNTASRTYVGAMRGAPGSPSKKRPKGRVLRARTALSPGLPSAGRGKAKSAASPHAGAGRAGHPRGHPITGGVSLQEGLCSPGAGWGPRGRNAGERRRCIGGEAISRDGHLTGTLLNR
jgi:hypothetical protein